MYPYRFRVWYGIGVAALALAAVPFLFLHSQSNPSVVYLESKPLSPWSVMALSAAGESPSLEGLKTVSGTKAIDLEAPILALAAAGKDPRTFGSADLVAKLKSFYDGTQLGEVGIINDDIFGLLALLASGEKTDDATVAGIRSFILSKQNADGGFSFAVGLPAAPDGSAQAGGGSDTNTTAAAIMALRAAGIESGDAVITNAISYLRAAQNEDGGFPYDPKSSWGTASDASSDAWVSMAIRAAGGDPGSLEKSGGTPLTHLESLRQAGGFYLYQAGGAEDSFTPVTTSYALLALSGKTLPVRVITPEVSAGALFSVQVEGKTALLCDTDGVGKTALDALKGAGEACSLSYHIQSSSLGEYVDEIAGEKASGASGWLYSVNGIRPSVGAGAYLLKEGDAVRWYFGNFDGTSAADALRTEIPLSVTIPAPSASPPLGGAGGGGGGNPPESDTTVSLIVEVNKGGKRSETLGFGTTSRGGVANKTLTLKNSGAVAATLSTSVSGDAVFRRYLRLNERTWRDYRATLPAQTSTTTALSLSVPADYAGNGVKTGALIFWATPAAQ